ncbi:MAG TPA: hypothetical protein VE871_02870 [Longimicrobium sp.]|nr:hypothetical protein [Longimicrobium sp.]
MMRMGIIAVAGLAGCAALRGAGAGETDRGGWLAREELRPGVFRVVQVSPARPRVGDSIWIAAVLVNRTAEPFAFTDPCFDDAWGERRLPLVLPPPDTVPPGMLGPGDVTCLGITHLTVQPGDTAVLSERRWGPLLRAGTFPVFAALYYGPRSSVDTLTVMLTVRP